jgi:hypothetical protein
MRLPSVNSDQGEHENTKGSQVDDTAGVEDVVL